MKNKKVLIIIMVTMLLVGVFNISYGATANESVKVSIGGKLVSFNDVQPQIINGRTMIPLRGLFEEIGAEVTWNNYNRSVKIQQGNKNIVFYVDSKNYVDNSKVKWLDVAPQIVDGRTLIPLRFVADGLNYSIDWDNTTRTVKLDNKVILHKIDGVRIKEFSVYNKGYYVGETKFDKPYGQGILYKTEAKKEKIYEGTFIAGKYFGIGTLYYRDGNPHIVGQWESGKIHGYAKVYDEFGNLSYQGYFEHDREVDYVPANTYKIETTVTETYLKISYKKYYKGEVEDEKPDGFGTLYDRDDNVIYKGYFKDGEYDGFGELYDAEELIFKGNFKDGEYHGNGKEYEDEKLVYDGEYDEGEKTGEGLVYIDSKLVYSGELKKGRPSGDGTLYSYLDEEEYFSGEWKYGRPHDGEYSMTENHFDIEYRYSNGNYEITLDYWDVDEDDVDVDIDHSDGNVIYENHYIYKGDLKNEKPDGYGKLYKKYNKDLYYEGNFVNGSMTGEGIIYYSDGDIKYEGSFKNGEYDGYGYLYYSDNDLKYHGYFEDGDYEDEGLLFFSNGEVQYDGEFKNGKKHGEGVLFDRNGEIIFDGEFQNGNMTSDGTFYNENPNSVIIYEDEGLIVKNGVVIYEGDIRDEVKHGDGKEYYESGVLKFNGEFYEGTYYGYGKKYDEDGTLEAEGYFKDGELKYQSDDGKVEIELDNGWKYIGEIKLKDLEYVYSGNGKSLYPSGNVRYEGEWVDGKFHGEGILYEDNGTIIHEGQFFNGEYDAQVQLIEPITED